MKLCIYKASVKGKSLKGYIEELLEEDSKRLAEPAVGYGYRFTYDREPSDAELMAVMEDAAPASSLFRISEGQLAKQYTTEIPRWAATIFRLSHR